MKQLKVDAIKNGTVIDHITAGKGLEVANILNLQGNNIVMIGINLNSSKLGKKDIIKIENKELTAEEVNTISLIAPKASLIIIKDFKVKNKEKVHIPRQINNIIKCSNPNCITNLEKVKSKFTVYNEKINKVRCNYCEKKYNVDEVKIEI